jgi:hypothetical protein
VCELNTSHIISTGEDPRLRIESFAVINLLGVTTNKKCYRSINVHGLLITNQAVCAIRPQSSMGAQFTNFARNVNLPSVMGKFSIYFILISFHFDYVLYYYIEKECLVLMGA